MLQILVNNGIVKLVFSIGAEYAIYSLKLGYTNCWEYAICCLIVKKIRITLSEVTLILVLVCAKYSALIAVYLCARRGIQPLAGRS